MLILLDQDGVLADFEHGFRCQWADHDHGFPAIQPVFRTSFRVQDDYPEHLQEQVEAVYQARGFYLNLMPISGAVEGVREMLAAGHDVRICTSPLDAYRHCVPEKYEWVERHLGAEFVRRVIVTKDKTIVAGDVLIDDNPRISGSRKPTWQHVVFDQPYNKSAQGPRMTWSNWRATLDICKQPLDKTQSD